MAAGMLRLSLRPRTFIKICSEQRGLLSRKRQVEVLVGEAGSDAASRGAVEESALNEEGFVDLFEGVLFFGKGGGEGVEADWASIVFLDDGHQQAAVEFVESVGVDFKHFEGVFGGGAVDFSRAAHLSVVANAAQQAVGNA